ncbi:ATP-binding protein, partial [Clostridium sardiniense]
MIKGYQSELMEVYQKIRNEEDKQLKQRRAEIKSLYPEILDLDNNIHKLSLKLTMTILKKDTSEADIRKIKDEITDLRAKKCEQLVSHGYDPEYLNMHYRCKKCQDTGYIGVEKCNCYKDKLVKLYYKDSELQDILKNNNFSNFNIDLFSSSNDMGEKYSPRTNM